VGLDAESIGDLSEEMLDVCSVVIVGEHVLAISPAKGDVLPAVDIDDARWTRHALILNPGCHGVP
jgi:hypothetical protein